MKRIISFILCFLLVLNFGVVLASAEEINGTWGTLNWVLDAEGTLTISGKGKINEINPYNDEAWSLYAEDIKTVIIENLCSVNPKS